MNDKLKIHLHRIFWLSVLIGSVLVALNYLQPVETEDAKLVGDNGYITEYYEYLDETNCEIEVKFNVPVDSGYITVSFYDKNEKLLSTEREYFWNYIDDNTLSCEFIGIEGAVDSYEIIDYSDITARRVSNGKEIFGLIILVVGIPLELGMLISALMLSCKVYVYNKKLIIVYAGRYHNYLKYGGVKVDEHNTFKSFSPIYLSCTLNDGTHIAATISLSKRISLKINDKLYTRMF